MKKIFDKVREWTGKQIPDKAIEMVLEVFAESDIYFPSDFTISLTKEQMQDAKKANIELNEKTKALFMELNHDNWGDDEVANENLATIIFGLVLTANDDTLNKEIRNKIKVSDAYKGGKEDVDFAKGIEYPISLKRTNDVKEYLDTKVSHPFPEVMFEDIRHTKKFTDIPWGVLTHLVSYYHAHNGDVTAKDMLGYVKRKMLKEVPLNKLGANIEVKTVRIGDAYIWGKQILKVYDVIDDLDGFHKVIRFYTDDFKDTANGDDFVEEEVLLMLKEKTMKLLHKGNGEKPKYKEGDVVFLNNGNVVVVEEVGCSAGGKEFIYLAHYADDDAQYPILESEIGGLTDENGFAPQQHPEVAKDIRDFGYYVDYLNLEGSGTSDIDKFTSVILLFIPDAGWDDMESSDGKKIVTKKVISLLKRNNVPVSAVVAELKRVKAKQHIEIDNELGEGQNSAFEVGDTVTFKGSYGRLIYGIVQETKGNVASVRALDDNYATDIAVDELKLITIPKPYRDGGVIDDSPPYFFYIEDGDNKAIVKIGYPKRGNGEGNLKEFLVRGEEPYGFGSKNYQSYLTKSDIDGWLSKDYDYVEAIETEEDFDNYLPSESDKAKNGANIGENVDVNVAEFNKYFMRNYGFISHSLSNKEVQKFLDQDVIKRVSLPKKADYFQDYILANGLQDDIQLEKGAKIPQFEKLPRNRQANKKYAYFAVGKADGKIVEGWEIVYDVQSLKDSAPNDLRDNDYNPKDFRILSKQTIIRTMGINPHDLDNWRKFDYSNDVKPEQAKNGANIKGVGHTYENRGDWKRDLQTHDALMSGEGDDIKFLQGKIKYKQEGEHLVAYLGSIKMGYWDYSLNEGYIYDDKFKNGGNLEDNLLDFDIPTWALSSLINGDDSGLEDEDIEKLNNFTDKIVAKYGNAHFMIGSDEDMESEFTYRNDIDGTLGGDVVTLYLRPSKKYKNGANIEGGFGNENALMVINNNKQIKHHTEELNSVVNSDTEVPAWVVAKVNRSASDLSDATHYLEGVNSKYANGGGVGNIKSKINELYSKSNFINDSFNWKLKLLEMLQDRSIEAYNIYQSLTKEQKEEVLQEQYEVDNDMGSDGDGSIKTTKENLKILLNGAKNGNKYSNGGNTLGFNYSIGGL